MHNTEEFLQRIEDCRELYLKYGGENHELIERKMRILGHHDFHRRILYRRFERGTCKPGWIETYGWRSLLSEPPAVAGGLTQPTAETQRREDATGIWPQINAVDADKNQNNILSLSALSASSAANYPQSPATAGGTDTAADFDAFKEWLKRVSPTMTWEWKHQVYIYKRLKQVTEGLCKRLMIFLPPRHGKSELVTVRYTAWRLKQDPAMNVIIASHTQQLANRFSRKIKRVLMDDADQMRNGGFGVREV